MTIIEAINNTAKALTNLSKVLVAVAEQTEGIPAKEAVNIPAKKEEKKAASSEETVTIEQVRAVLAEKSQAGLTAQVKTLLESFGANKLSAVKPEDYAAVLAEAKKL
ncbi:MULTISPECIES: DNA ligase [unclassified Blautia]|uniref:DNA ligase n=1 Tax=unclassified Blautia TaxID=2648079 RepID=UPI003F8C0B89